METNWSNYNTNNNNETTEQRSSSIDRGQNLTTASPQKEARTSPFSQSSEIECNSSSRKHLIRDSLDFKKNPEEKRRLSFDETLGFVDDSNSTCCYRYQDCLHRGSVSCSNRRPRRSSVYSGTHRRSSKESQQSPTHQPWGFSTEESKNSLTPVHEESLDKGLKQTDDKSHLAGLTSSTTAAAAAAAAANRLLGKNDSLGQQDQTKDLEPSAMTYGQESPQETKVHSDSDTQGLVGKNNLYSTDNVYGQPKSLQKEVPILNSTDGSYPVSNTQDNSRFAPLSTNDSSLVEGSTKQSPEAYGSPKIPAEKSTALEGNTKEEKRLGKRAVEEGNALRTTTFGQDASSDQTSPDSTAESTTLGQDALIKDQGSALNSNTFGQGTPAEPVNPTDDVKPMQSSISNRPKGTVQTQDSFTDPVLTERARYPLDSNLDNHTPPLDSDHQVVPNQKRSLGGLGTASTFATQKPLGGDVSNPVDNKWMGRPENSSKQVEKPAKGAVSQRNDESISSTQAINGETSSDESNRLKKLASKNEAGGFKSRAAAAGGAALSSAFRRFSHGSSHRMSAAEVYKQSQSGSDWTGQNKTEIPDSMVLAESSGPETDDSMHSRQRYPSANEPMKMGPDYDPRSAGLSSVPPKEESKNVLATIVDQHAFGGGHAFGTEDGRNQKTEIDEIDNNKDDTRRKSRKGSLQKVFGKLFHKNVS